MAQNPAWEDLLNIQLYNDLPQSYHSFIKKLGMKLQIYPTYKLIPPLTTSF